MGILYNRFTDSSAQTLIPYSNQSNILTYLVPSSFKGNSSTVWGDDYPLPMVRGTSLASNWQYNSVDDSVYCHGASFVMTPWNWGIDNLTTYTVYMVVRWNVVEGTTNLPCFSLNRRYGGSSDRIYELYDVRVRAHLIGTGSNYNSYLTPSSSSTDNYHAYAFRHCVGKFCHVVDDQNLVTISAPNYSSSSNVSLSLQNIEQTDTHNYSANVKFISIVNGEESDSTILNNVSNIRTRLNLL